MSESQNQYLFFSSCDRFDLYIRSALRVSHIILGVTLFISGAGCQQETMSPTSRETTPETSPAPDESDRSNSAALSLLYHGEDVRMNVRIIQYLKQHNMTYLVGKRGKILVSRERVLELRMALVYEHIASGSAIGETLIGEIDTFGVPQLRIPRILEGELARTISTIAGVKSARVHLSVPKEELFIEDKKPRASVILYLLDNHQLSKSYVQSIVELVAGAVSGLEEAQVSVRDQTGRALERDSDVEGQLVRAYKSTFEESLHTRAQESLERVVGQGNVVVVVAADLEFDHARVEEFSRDKIRNFVLIKRLDITVLVNSNYKNKPHRKGKSTRLSESELAKLRNLVSSAVGYNKERGDQMILMDKPFQETEADLEAIRKYLQE